FVNAAVEGTEFVVKVAQDEGSVTVLEGRVSVENSAGAITLGAGQSASAARGAAPRAVVVVNPRDAVQWALYYPPLFDRRPLKTGPVRGEGKRASRISVRVSAGGKRGGFSRARRCPGLGG